ncbi:MAG: hypothetical protein WEE64_08490 [Dehalococcoidia bacterium]
MGIDANPWAVILARSKTQWNVRPAKLASLADQIADTVTRQLNRDRRADPGRRWFLTPAIASDPAFEYFTESGMVERGWIGLSALARTIRLRQAVEAMAQGMYRDALLVALAATGREDMSNLSNGPEVYVGYNGAKRRDVVAAWLEKVCNIAQDLGETDKSLAHVPTRVIHGDSRACSTLVPPGEPFSMVVTSPPYPADHDYTRNVRLELALLGYARDRSSLQAIRRRMIRSHSKSVYKGDDDSSYLGPGDRGVLRIVGQLQRLAQDRSDGFARQYPKVVAHYFGGLLRHIYDLTALLAPGGHCAFVLGDQQSFLNVPIRTAKLFADLIVKRPELNLDVQGIVELRQRYSPTRQVCLSENAVIIAKRDTIQ